MEWKFYGRSSELAKLKAILNRRRWFFTKITGRRRIGKTRLIQEALAGSEEGGRAPIFYVQIPDSAPSGVVAAVRDAAETFRIDLTVHPLPKDLLSLAKFLADLMRSGYVVALDEFQYFNRPKLKEFCSYLQNEIDRLSATPDSVRGGLFVLGSIHTEMVAILKDRGAPLYNRITDEVDVTHWEISSLLQLFQEFGVTDPHQILFFWNLFEGVPKFYRDCFEQQALQSPRLDVLKKMFFESSSPLRTEADNWFLKELHGRYDTILKYVARNSGCTHSDLVNHVRSISEESEEQVGGHLQVLQDKYKIIEKKLPIFSSAKGRKGRYYVVDNFLRSWLGALSAPVSAINFSPSEGLLAQANERLMKIEGYGLEKLVGIIYEERSRKGLGGFQLSQRIEGFWDRSDVEIDLVAVDERSKKIRFGSCKRSEGALIRSVPSLRECAEKFLKSFSLYKNWQVEYVAVSPAVSDETRRELAQRGVIAESFSDLFTGLR